jgi:hypothetical protein
MIADLYHELAGSGVQMKIAEATWQVRRMLRVSGVEKMIGEEVTQATSLDTVLQDWNCLDSRTPVCLTDKGPDPASLNGGREKKI